MKLENIKEIRKLMGEQVSDSLKEVGTPELRLLCDSIIRIDALIKRLEDPTQAIKDDKKMNSKIWK